MPTLLYLHGFDSSPGAKKAELLKTWIAENRPDIELLIPQLPFYPEQVAHFLEELMFDRIGEEIGIIGASLGGFYATWLSQCFMLPAVVINPLVHPAEYLIEYLDKPYQSRQGEVVILTHQHLDDFQVLQLPRIEAPDLIWLLAQTGDEVLPYQQAVEYYALCRQTIESGGNHSFAGFENYIPEVINFLGL
ncbi:esterase YqiA [Zophobihabitans entericus]|uniref:Esterase YqiA n=1 Tax=Zophobihabitans entericus TaxID=1635327 RepID=A0A6G9IAD4_9GAMM|nr:esterase YqiA [Zophobihabitans entericus]QIQ20789.1 esterase YqiA [Zophobihabitans entericus]